MKIEQRNANSPNFQGFIRFSRVIRQVGGKTIPETDFVLNTDTIRCIRPIKQTKNPLGAYIETSGGDVIKINEKSEKGTENKFDNIVSHIIQAHKEGYTFLKIFN